MASSEPSLADSGMPLAGGRDSYAGTVMSTAGYTAISEAQSKSGTAVTAQTQTGGRSTQYGGEGSTFSSPSPSVRSLTTTLTTMQSSNTNAFGGAPGGMGMGGNGGAAINGNNFGNGNGGGGGGTGASPSHVQSYSFTTQQIGSQFAHQFPTTVQQGVTSPQLNTYSSATANNLLTDNASVLTLASSSKQPRRRNSLDTNASIRALPPSSMFSNSRESLPLSVLSEMVNSGTASSINQPTTPTTTSVLLENGPGAGVDGTLNSFQSTDAASSERLNVYSSTGMTNLNPDRSSYYRRTTTGADAVSVRSGRGRHVRAESSPSSLSVGSSVVNV
ncbi:hypothetical protein AAP_06178 [Ascosphaera apis ARSEF 7405]|uniref:Uncharacterized protein n=1 Tax=Ascosphaera apis ARSEF 7405 TaxID=392613 RepID=A0A167UZZ4_9EURO|nr:hypothetical protein AAP_06178 [Ascosphaera apis ARSEF 7405]